MKDKNKSSLYTVLRRDESGKLVVKWYREEYKEQIDKVCELLDKAIGLAEDAGLKKYLQERKKAFQTDDYFASDMAWMDMILLSVLSRIMKTVCLVQRLHTRLSFW